MLANPRVVPRLLLALALAATAAVVLAPGLVPEPRQRGDSFTTPGWFPTETRPSRRGEAVPWSGVLGTDYLGRPFVLVLGRGFSATVRVALVGTAVVAAACIAVGALHGSTRSRGVEGLMAAGNLGVMAVPEAAVLITLAAAWPRTAPAFWVNLSMVSVLVLFAIPTGARLIADRVRAVQRSGFVAASLAYGAGPARVFFHDVWPHLVEDVAWVVAAVLPRFVAVEVGLAYLGVEYRDFEGLGRTLSKSFSNLNDSTASIQLLVTIAAVLWAALLPQLALRLLRVRARQEVAP